ncbi:MAG: AraC family transcriptional regulator [Opitutaceae bacterium]|nr:AraC family transcriptional regulator [Opitutaceae bacterium]
MIELIALLHPASARLPEADGEGGGKARGKAGGKAGGERGFCLHPSVERALRHIEVSFCKPLSLDEIAAQAAVTPGYLSHLFAIEVGETLSSYLRRVRMKHAARLLGDGKCNVSEAAKAVGYASIGQFSHAFRDHFGYPPGQHVHRGAGVR